MKFNNKVVFITGGSRGIGSAIVRAFAREGASVVFTYKSKEKTALCLEEELTEDDLKVEACSLDVTDADTVNNIIQYTVDKYGKIDILVNNAGITWDNFLMLMSDKAWDDVIDINLKGIFHCCRSVMPSMIKQRKGIIINISSVAGLMGVSGQTNYCASKAGVIGLTRALAREVVSKNIRVNAVAPGYIKTDMFEKVEESVRKNMVKNIPCKRVGNVDEVAAVVLFLASEDASYIFGHTIVVDGGLLA